MCALLSKPKDTLQTLIEAGTTPETPHGIIRKEIQARLAKSQEKGTEYESSLQALFPNAILDVEVLESLVTALLAGNHVLLFGPSGSGKTVLAKEVLNLMPKDIWIVDECPVQDDPFSVADPTFYKRVPCCPFCKAKYGGGVEDFDPRAVDPKAVIARRARIREGHGFARVQGSAEVFPDNLTGTINIRKLEEVGDPMSPLVLEPGKLLQANRGILIVDEVGKLPLGTQNVLLQALQESIVSPAKSRETYPAAFISLTTSNITDLDNINDPLNDRLANVYVGFCKSHARNRLIAEMGSSRAMGTVLYLDLLFDTGIRMVEAWRQTTGELYELSEVGSNRTLIDVVTRAVAHAQIQGRNAVDIKDFRYGLTEAMLSHIRARGGDSYSRDKDTVETFLKDRFNGELKAAADAYWCRFFEEDLKGNKDLAAHVLADGQDVANDKQGGKDWLRFVDHVGKRERYKGGLADEVVAKRLFKMMKKSGTFGDLK
jgi:MoxR-like ATPase